MMEKNDLKNPDKQQKKRTGITALVLASAIIFSLLMLFYAFIQRTEADRSRKLAENTLSRLIQVEQEAMQAREEAVIQREIAEKHRMMAVLAEQRAMQVVSECQQKKRN